MAKFLTFEGLSHFYDKIKSILNNIKQDINNNTSAINCAANRGAKNLLKNTATSNTVNGVTFTVNDDGSVTVNGTATANAFYYINAGFEVEKGNYIVTTGVQSFSIRTCYIGIRTTDNVDYNVVENTKIVLNNRTRFRWARIAIYEGVTINNLTVYPMIRPAEITDSTYVPYGKTNSELTTLEAQNSSMIGVVANCGAKNFLESPVTSKIDHGVTFMVNSDGSVTANGTATMSNSEFDLPIPKNLAGTKCILTGCPQGGGMSQTFRILLRDITNNTNLGSDVGNGVTVTLPNPIVNVVARINVFGGYTADNLTFYPMLRYAEIEDDTYVPYAPTNRELYEMILNLQNNT